MPAAHPIRWPWVVAVVAMTGAMPHTGCLLTTDLDGLAGNRPPPAEDAGEQVDGCAPGTSDCDTTEGCETTTSSDSKNCGKCGRDCLDGTCENGACKPIKIAETLGAKAFAVEPGNLYWVNDQGAVYWMKGSDKASLIASGQSIGDAPSVAADTESIYWTTSIAVLKANKTTKALTTIASSQNKPKSLALYSSSVYWIHDKAVMRAPKAGGTTSELALEASAPEQVKVDASGVYWVVYGSNELRFVGHAGGAAKTLNAEYTGPKSLVLGSTSVFVADHGSDSGFNNGIISSVPKAGGARQVLASTQTYPQGIDTDGTHVYWANFNGGAIVRVAQAGGETPVRVAEANSPTVVASPQGDNYVWWIASDDKGTGIWRVAK